MTFPAGEPKWRCVDNQGNYINDSISMNSTGGINGSISENTPKIFLKFPKIIRKSVFVFIQSDESAPMIRLMFLFCFHSSEFFYSK